MLSTFTAQGYVPVRHWLTGAIERCFAKVELRESNTLVVRLFPKHVLLGDNLVFMGHHYTFSTQRISNTFDDIVKAIDENHIVFCDNILRKYTWDDHQKHIEKCAKECYGYYEACYLCGDTLDRSAYSEMLKEGRERIDSYMLSCWMSQAINIYPQEGVVA